MVKEIQYAICATLKKERKMKKNWIVLCFVALLTVMDSVPAMAENNGKVAIGCFVTQSIALDPGLMGREIFRVTNLAEKWLQDCKNDNRINITDTEINTASIANQYMSYYIVTVKIEYIENNSTASRRKK